VTSNANITLFSNSNAVGNIVSSGDGNLQTTGANIFGYINATGNIITTANFVGRLANGNSNIAINGNANIILRANGNIVANIVSSGDGNIQTTGANIFGYANVVGNVFAGNHVGPLANGNSNIFVSTANGNITFTATGNANVLVLQGGTSSEAIFKGNANVTSNLHVLANSVLKVAGNTGSSTWFAGIRASTDSANFVANYTITLPPTSGANNQWLMVDAGGNLRFSNKFVRYAETVVAGGSVSGVLSPDLNTGTIFQYTLTGNASISTLTNVTSGSSFILEFTQDATGSRIMTWGSTWKFSAGAKALSINPSSTDVVAGFYDGTNYYATVTRGFV
jgi:hypothetical protein